MCAAVYGKIFFGSHSQLFSCSIYFVASHPVLTRIITIEREGKVSKKGRRKDRTAVHRPGKIRDFSTRLWYIFWQFGRQNIFAIRFGYIVYAVLLVLPEAGGVEAAAGQEDESPRGQTPAVSALSGRQSWNCVHIFAGWREKKRCGKLCAFCSFLGWNECLTLR